MMRQSPKPYAKGAERQNPSSSPVTEVLPVGAGLSTASCVEYQK